MTWRGSAKRSGTKSLLRCVQTWWPTTRNIWPDLCDYQQGFCHQVLSHVLRRDQIHISLIKMQINESLFWNVFFWIFCCYSVSHGSNKPTIQIIDWSFLCQWANVQNQQGIKWFFPLTLHINTHSTHANYVKIIQIYKKLYKNKLLFWMCLIAINRLKTLPCFMQWQCT